MAAASLSLRTLYKSLTPRVISTAGKRITQVAGVGLVMAGLQKQFGKADDFFDHRFITTKKAEDLADFYGSEDFMEIFCVFPFVVQFMMRGSVFDDEGICHAWGLTGPGQMEVSIEFQEREEDLDGDGEPDTIAWFNKRENFKEVSSWGTLLNMTQNFGYNRRTDGTCEVYHHGERFEGFFPIRFVFALHSKYVAWATQRYIESKEFGAANREEEAEILRQNIPLYAFKELIANLTTQVELAREQNKDDATITAEHDKTLAALRRMSFREEKDENVTLAHFQTVRRHGTLQKHVTLVVKDRESAETIRSAMQQISRNPKQNAAPVDAIGGLQHRMTVRAMSAEAQKEK